jgi:hypothetical protein
VPLITIFFIPLTSRLLALVLLIRLIASLHSRKDREMLQRIVRSNTSREETRKRRQWGNAETGLLLDSLNLQSTSATTAELEITGNPLKIYEKLS